MAASALALAAVLTGCGSSASSSSSSVPAASTTTAAPPSTGAGSGVIKGVPFTAGGAFVQYDPMQKGWWIVLTGSGHKCTDVTSVAGQLASAVTPNVNVFLRVSGPAALPAYGRRADTGVALDDATGYPNTINGPDVTVTLTHAEAAVGGHWQGSVKVPTQSLDGKAYGFKGTFDAVVCPKVSG